MEPTSKDVYYAPTTGSGQARRQWLRDPSCSRLFYQWSTMLKDAVAQTREHVLKGRTIVARQRVLIERIRTQRRDPKQAEELLVRFEASLSIFEEHLERLEGG